MSTCGMCAETFKHRVFIIVSITSISRGKQIRQWTHLSSHLDNVSDVLYMFCRLPWKSTTNTVILLLYYCILYNRGTNFKFCNVCLGEQKTEINTFLCVHNRLRFMEMIRTTATTDSKSQSFSDVARGRETFFLSCNCSDLLSLCQTSVMCFEVKVFTRHKTRRRM